ncbi:hypothetical protein MBLNU230_g5849t1 [Neophaeotheca triangularis]
MQDVTLSEASGAPIDTHELSHLRMWQDAVAANPNKTALISPNQDSTAFRWVGSDSNTTHLEWTFTELDRAARRLATKLNSLAPINRRPIATLIRNQAEWALFFWAAAYLHAPLMPINPANAIRSDELTHMVKLMRPVVFVSADTELASQMETSLDDAFLADIPTKILLTKGDKDLKSEWSLLTEIMSGDPTPPHSPLPPDHRDYGLILFTSGTTSLPKPCAHTSAQVVNAAIAYMEARDITKDHRIVHHLPGFHAYGITWGLVFWLAGGSVVYPSAAFEAQASLQAIDRYKCTHTSLVPTTAQSILAHPALPTTDLSSMISIDISGAGVLPSVVTSCEAALKIPGYTSYGMTESPGSLIWPEGAGSVLRRGEVFSGMPSRGTTVKICEQGTRNAIPRGQAGELHVHGIQVIEGYLDPNVDSSAFYKDEEGKQWVVTGDQAIMAKDGAVTIAGRYKDLIIRGGENISPASIESYLQKFEGVHVAQVVGTPDEMAGEVPVAVIQTLPSCTATPAQLKTGASDALGTAFAPKFILNLQDDLGLADFPKTASGKVRKVELAVIVKEYLAAHQAPAVNKDAPTVESLINIWTKISGAEGLLPETLLESFADSLMMMQLSGIVKAELGKDITVEDFKECEKINDQADLIDSRQDRSAMALLPQREGPPGIDDVAHVAGDHAAFRTTQAQVNSVIAPFGLAWTDVEDVMTLPDWEAIFANRIRPASWNLRWSYSAPVDVATLERAVRETLPYHPTFRSLIVERAAETPLLATIRACDEWFAASMTTGWEVEKKEDMNELLLGHPELDNASSPGPLFKIHLVHIKDTGMSGFVLIASHAIIDASMTKLWTDDLITSMHNTGTLIPHVSFKDYSDAFLAHRDGPEANKGLAYWTNKLSGIGLHPTSTYWPEQRAPEFYKGNDYGWHNWDGSKPTSTSARKTLQSAKSRAQLGVRRLAAIQDMTALKASHNVPVFMLVKSAIALLNIRHTHAREAIFGTINAARTWPFAADFTPDEKSKYSGNPLDISGCTVEYALDRIAVDPTTTLLEFMQTVTKDEETNSAYIHTPFNRIVSALRSPTSASDPRSPAERETDANALVHLVRRQSFNWLPTSPTASQDPRGVKMEQMLTRMDNGLTITGFLADDKKSVALSFTWDAEHLTLEEAEAGIGELKGLCEELGRREGWGRRVGELVG